MVGQITEMSVSIPLTSSTVLGDYPSMFMTVTAMHATTHCLVTMRLKLLFSPNTLEFKFHKILSLYLSNWPPKL